MKALKTVKSQCITREHDSIQQNDVNARIRVLRCQHSTFNRADTAKAASYMYLHALQVIYGHPTACGEETTFYTLRVHSVISRTRRKNAVRIPALDHKVNRMSVNTGGLRALL